jgi:SAM-dependent MidA family methyltransferase
MGRSISTPAKSHGGSEKQAIGPKTARLLAKGAAMAEEKSELHELIRGEIAAAGGMIPFRRFMELALYHPEHGYYASGRARVGKSGDFFTSVSVGSIYGRLLASVCREVWKHLGSPEEFTIVEQGANDGTMASDLLGMIAGEGGAFADAMRYLIVEPFPVNRERQQESLSRFGNVFWREAIEDLPSFTGVHLSNELLDAFPVDSLRWDGSSWEEECVSRDGDSLVWKTRPITEPDLTEAVIRLPVPIREGWRFEINRGISPWLSGIASRMKQGLILTVDYGQVGNDRFAPHRADGTLLAYRNHERFDDPLAGLGLRDITAQVDFTDLAEKAVALGLTPLAYSDQQHFLMGTAEPWMRSLRDHDPEHQKDLLALKTLLTPSLMGSQFKVIALGKDFPTQPPLACFKYQRPGVGVL